MTVDAHIGGAEAPIRALYKVLRHWTQIRITLMRTRLWIRIPI
jgi:hypothetical protein